MKGASIEHDHEYTVSIELYEHDHEYRASIELYGHDREYIEPLLKYMDMTMIIESL